MVAVAATGRYGAHQDTAVAASEYLGSSWALPPHGGALARAVGRRCVAGVVEPLRACVCPFAARTVAFAQRRHFAIEGVTGRGKPGVSIR